MVKFKAGDVVRIVKPANVDKYPKWVKGMDIYNGAIVTLESDLDSELLFHKEFSFNAEWLEKIENMPPVIDIPDGYEFISLLIPKGVVPKGSYIHICKPKTGDLVLIADCDTCYTTETRELSGLQMLTVISLYRTPTSKDIGKTIECKLDSDGPWFDCKLLMVQEFGGKTQFIADDNGWVNGYDFARIKKGRDRSE